MIFRCIFFQFVIFFNFFIASVAFASQCNGLIRPEIYSLYEINVDTNNSIRNIGPEYFGFNLEWVMFQLSCWDSTKQQVVPEVVELLKAFPGAVYRYPGGTVANYFEWQSAVGNRLERKPQTPVTWRGPLVAEFGLSEYLKFIESVEGKAWYVINLYGALDEERSPEDMAREVARVATYFRKEREAGRPSIFRWELGNELDRNIYRWSPEKYSKIALTMLKYLHSVDSEARAVSLAQDWPASLEKHGIDAVTYNQFLGRAFKGKISEFSSHLYYDNHPWGPPVPNLVKRHCENSQSIKQGAEASTSIWVTEHGRPPKGTPADKNWEKNWKQTADLAAAIGLADMAIALAQETATKGLFVHALHGSDGPWPLFHRRKIGGFVPSVTYWGLCLLRESLLDEVLSTSVKSANQSNYEGGYDLRAVALSNAERDKFSVWLVNRAEKTIDVRLALSNVLSKTLETEVSILADADTTLNNYGGVSRLQSRRYSKSLIFDASGSTRINVPGNAVMAIRMQF